MLTSTRATGEPPPDAFSDYDVILVTNALEPMAADEGWTHWYGPVMTRWGDDGHELGQRVVFRGVVYDDGVRIDYSLWPVKLAQAMAGVSQLPPGLDAGYRVLLDEDGLLEGWPEPSRAAYVLAPPTEAEYRDAVDEFWWDTIYVAKSLARRDLVFAKFNLEYDTKLVALRRMLEWQVAAETRWSFSPRPWGRDLAKHLPPAVREALTATYAGAELDKNWEALFRTAALFRECAGAVARVLGYAYPEETERKVLRYLRTIRQTSP